jgi:hypothetical protein
MGAPSTDRNVDGKAFAIGVLSVTACILFVGFLLVTMLPTPAYGIGQSDRSGDYIMLTQQVSNSVEALVVIDAATQRMNVYAMSPTGNDLQLVQANIALNRLPGTIEEERKGD